MNSALSSAHLAVVAFVVAGQRFAVEAQQIRAARLAADGSEDLSLPSLAALLGLPTTADEGPRQVLQVKTATADQELSLAGPVQMTTLAVADIHPVPALLAARCRIPGLRALAVDAAGVTLLVDLRTLLSAAVQPG